MIYSCLELISGNNILTFWGANFEDYSLIESSNEDFFFMQIIKIFKTCVVLSLELKQHISHKKSPTDKQIY